MASRFLSDGDRALVRGLMAAEGLSVQDVAAMLPLHRNHVSNILAGTQAVPPAHEAAIQALVDRGADLVAPAVEAVRMRRARLDRGEVPA